jgi:hypothetical protein
MKAGWANPATEVLIKLYCTHVMLSDRLAARLPTLDLDDKKFGRPEAVSTRQHAHNNNARMLATKGVSCGLSAALFARDCNHCSDNNICGSS